MNITGNFLIHRFYLITQVYEKNNRKSLKRNIGSRVRSRSLSIREVSMFCKYRPRDYALCFLTRACDINHRVKS